MQNVVNRNTANASLVAPTMVSIAAKIDRTGADSWPARVVRLPQSRRQQKIRSLRMSKHLSLEDSAACQRSSWVRDANDLDAPLLTLIFLTRSSF